MQQRQWSPRREEVPHVLQSTQACETSVLVAAPFKNGQQPTGKAKAGDYDDHVKKMINDACHQYEILLATEDPYPSPSTAVVWAARVWADVSRSSPSKFTLSNRIEKIITGRGSHARGALRDRLRPLIASTYGFSSEGSTRAKNQNISKHAYLLDSDASEPDARFHYADISTRRGFAHNTVILTVLKDHWFGSADAPGIKYMDQFSPVREVTLALMFTTIEYCIDQWATGIWDKTLIFSNKIYHSKYKQHLQHIQDWGRLDADATRGVRQRMYDRARRASGAPAATLPPAGLPEHARDRLRDDLVYLAAADHSGEEGG
ncbi:hypothetical protein PYCCODRAFT_1476789 [Trametes coccinea BRFM310]|uniref:DUF6532 domain-containing protein n=1 Tax=Trametes coccinea (strain BRFM310) TaxID=1353009 RepID=A0A1Y2IUI8_TRAC3|nr:hypothetical protein PYCCODRAFT_1476789 [Trametes coccinea BRFM310]